MPVSSAREEGNVYVVGVERVIIRSSPSAELGDCGSSIEVEEQAVAKIVNVIAMKTMSVTEA